MKITLDKLIAFSKLLLIYLLAVPLLEFEHCYAQPSFSPQKITTVTVLSDRAEVTREQMITCSSVKEGVTALFEKLPSLVRVKTLRATIAGKADVIGITHHPHKKVILPFEADLTQQDSTEDKKAQDLSKKMDILEAELTRIQHRLTLLNQEKESIKEAVSHGLATGKLDDKVLEQSLSRIVEQQGKLRERKLAIGHEQHRLNLQATKLAIAATKQPLAKTIQDHGGNAIVSITCRAKGRFTVNLSYVTAGASWQLDYTVNLNSKRKQKADVLWRVNALVRQATGEDWTNAQLYLSTAQPNLGDRAPLPRSLHIFGHKESQTKVLSQRAEDRQSLQGGDLSNPAEQAEMTVEDRGQSFGLKVPNKITILSDGQSYWLPVSTSKTKAKMSLVTTPKLSTYVYRVARFNNPAPHPLPQGQITLNFDGKYLGKLTNKHYGQGEPIELTLGIEKSLRVERILEQEKDKEAGLLENDQSLVRLFKINLRSSSKKTQRVEVVDNIPVSEIEDVLVKLNKKKTTKGYKLTPKTGFITWDISLKPLAKEEVLFGYTVKLPEDWKIR